MRMESPATTVAALITRCTSAPSQRTTKGSNEQRGPTGIVGTAAAEIAAEAAKTLGIKIYTVGAGTRGEAPVPVQDSFGRQTFAMAKVDIDEETLQRVAEMTDGKYFRATDTKSLEKIYDEINQLEKTERTIKQYAQYRELFAWLLLPGLLVMATQLGLSATSLQRVP